MTAETLSVNEAAARIGVSERTLYEHIRQGRCPFPVLAIGRKKRIPVRPFERWLSTGSVNGDAA
jgi:excisionase family DNA binding protein